MALDFNSRGDLYQTIQLTYEEFVQHSVTTPYRSKLFRNAVPFIEIFYRCGCSNLFVAGSFVSRKTEPEDIDLCFDLSNAAFEKIEEIFPQFFDVNEIGRINRDHHCHIFYLDEKYKDLFNLLNEDREGYIKGLVNLNLKDILRNYDQE